MVKPGGKKPKTNRVRTSILSIQTTTQNSEGFQVSADEGKPSIDGFCYEEAAEMTLHLNT
jgi:hypothetical protein